MTTASSEATPFNNFLSRQKARARPARTYSKRPAPDTLNDQSLKRQRLSPPPTPFTPTTEPDIESLPSLPPSRASTPGLPVLPKPSPPKKPAKGTILNFFKPVQRLSSPVRSDAVFTSPQYDGLSSDSPLSDIDDDFSDDEENPAESESIGPIDPLSSSPPAPRFKKYRVRPARRLRLKSVVIDSVGSGSAATTMEAEVEQTGVKKGTKKKFGVNGTVPVQTTLNLSNKPAFDECKVCGALYNPLHPPDVKFHNKIHAAALRAKKKEKKNKAQEEEAE